MVLERYRDVTDTKTELPQLIRAIATLVLARKNRPTEIKFVPTVSDV